MNPESSATEPPDSRARLQLFRNVIARLDPTQPLQSAADQQWYVERPEGIGTSIARSLQVDPRGSHLVVGAIGCGKSTELLAAGRILLETPGVFARYVEVSQALDLGAASGDALAIAVADDLAEYLSKRYPQDQTVTEFNKRVKDLVVDGRYGWEEAPEERPGLQRGLPRPQPDVPPFMGTYLPLLKEIKTIVEARFNGSRLVWLLDGLDRITDPIDFDRITLPFLKALKEIGVGVAIVGPSRSIRGLDRQGAASSCDELHWMGPVDPTEEGAGWRFLNEVLEARAIDEVVPKECQRSLVRWSGGAMRILLQLTREAIKETWRLNMENVGPDQVEAAADKIGRNLLRALSDGGLVLLKTLLKTGEFASRSAEDMALILNNLVLEYETARGLSRYAVHPTLIKFVKALPEPRGASRRGDDIPF